MNEHARYRRDYLKREVGSTPKVDHGLMNRTPKIHVFVYVHKTKLETVAFRSKILI
jgi:hypothetical protein